jgi:hypothetical protein
VKDERIERSRDECNCRSTGSQFRIGKFKLRPKQFAFVVDQALAHLQMAEPSWQELLRLRLIERDAKESSFSSVIEQCQYIL